jgi:hypothetical protein
MSIVSQGILPRGCNHQGEVSENADAPQLAKVTVAAVRRTSEWDWANSLRFTNFRGRLQRERRPPKHSKDTLEKGAYKGLHRPVEGNLSYEVAF